MGLIISKDDFIKNREAYCYKDSDCHFFIHQAGTLDCVGKYNGVFSNIVPSGNGIVCVRLHKV